MKIATVVGARPQFIKAAVVSHEIRKTNQEILIHTGQHYDYNMSDKIFEELEIPQPDYHLGISGGTHARMTARMMIKIEEVLQKESPDWVLLYGDTNSTLAAALTFVCWPETMVDKRNELSGPVSAEIYIKLNCQQTVDPKYQPFGDGSSSKKIVKAMENYFLCEGEFRS